MTRETGIRTSHGASKHGDRCTCTRCVGFTEGNAWRVAEGNQLAKQHGAYSAHTLSARAAEIAPALVRDFQGTADQLLLAAVAEAAAQFRIGIEAMSQVGTAPAHRLEYVRLSEDCRAWMRTLLKVLDRVGATPQARSEVAARLARAGIDARLAPDERVELETLEAQTVNGDLLTLGDMRDRVRLRDLRRKAHGG